MTHSKLHGAEHMASGTDPSLIGSQIYVSGNYYGAQAVAFGTLQPANGQLLLAPFVVARSITVDRILASVSTFGSTGAVGRLGIYGDNGKAHPGALVLDAGTVTATTNGQKEITISKALTPGIYWLGCVNQGAPTTLPIWRSINNGVYFSGFTALTNAIFNVYNGTYSLTGVTGALPDPFVASPPAAVTSSAVTVLLRAA